MRRRRGGGGGGGGAGLYPGEGRVTFMLYQLFQQFGAAVGFALPLFVPLQQRGGGSRSSLVQLWVQAASVALAWLLFLFARMQRRRFPPMVAPAAAAAGAAGGGHRA